MSVRKPRTDDETDVVAMVRKTASTHASGMPDLIGISISVRQGEPVNSMRVDLELDCGTSLLKINEGFFVVSMSTCFVGLKLTNCDIKPNTKYQTHVIVGSLEATATETHDRSSGRETDAGVDVSVQINGTKSKWPIIGGMLKARGSKKVASSSRQILKRTPRIDLVVTAGQDRWQVGDPEYGDARKADGRLSGSYFGEERDTDGEAKPLCVVESSSQDRTSEIVASAIVRFGQLQVRLESDIASREQREDVDGALRDVGRRVVSQHRRQEKDLRALVAGFVLSKAMHTSQRSANVHVNDGEFLIAQQTIITVPKGTLMSPKKVGK